ncbi:MAG: type I-E CRISPR-associated protein Cas5/CasD [Firmicutes bacterium]|nr:type I-E CRISPR-associated protein Cas5/CasD [Bacillota bacterium]
MKALILRMDAPMMSFGSVMVDHHGFIDPFPGISALTGMFANALGWHHSNFDALQELQDRLDFAARWDIRPERMIDYHTVDLGAPKMRMPSWTTRGEVEHRAGGEAAKRGTHQRYRHYWVDGLMTLAVGLLESGIPDLEDIKDALEKPSRPLFLGRKTCLPARPLLDPLTPILEGQDLLSILEQVPVWERNGEIQQNKGATWACWTPANVEEQNGENRLVYDLRDWHNQLPAGGRWRAEGMIGGEK